jgi:hypothetical protein
MGPHLSKDAFKSRRLSELIKRLVRLLIWSLRMPRCGVCHGLCGNAEEVLEGGTVLSPMRRSPPKKSPESVAPDMR